MRVTLNPESDKPRIVARYRGLQLVDARDFIRVVFDADPPRGMRWCLKNAGFKPAADGAWERRMCPDAIFQAQAIAKIFSTTDQETP